jgi:asparagine synthase (glutamine-hydrolysing)
MCGIAGIVGEQVDKHLLRQMLKILRHRGPDSEGIYVDDEVVLGACRLAVIDLVTGDQPITNEEGDVVIVYNGEVYNYKDLRRRLEERGHRFKTATDTEVLLHAYEELGEAFVNELNGMYAFAIWDERYKRLLLGRDPLGIKPLYYIRFGRSLAFASEAKALLLLKKPLCDPVALKMALNLGYIIGERSMFDGVKKLKAGCILLFQRGEAETKEYWSPPSSVESGLTLSDAASVIRSLVESSVESHMVSDVPIGAFLSGGLDTGTVVALMSRLSGAVRTFTLGFAEPMDELADAKRVADYFGTEHHDLILNEEELLREYPSMVWHAEVPKINLYPYFVSKLASRYVKVVLSGMGGDELFGGYIYRYKHIRRAETISRFRVDLPLRLLAKVVLAFNPPLPNKYRRRLFALLFVKDRARFFLLLHSPALIEEALVEITPFFATKESFLEQAMHAELRTKLVDDLLLVDDAMTMAHSLEERVPLLDKRLVEYALKIPVDMKVRGDVGKIIFREAVKDLLPDFVLKKPKWGFSIDIKRWYTKSLREISKQILDKSRLAEQGLIDYNKVKNLLSQAPSRLEAYEARYLWLATLAEIWFRLYIEGLGYEGKSELNRVLSS